MRVDRVALVATGLALAGCGGSSSRDVVEQFAEGWNNGNYEDACDTVDPRRYISLADQAAANGRTTVAVHDCVKSLSVLARLNGSEAVGAVQDADETEDAAQVETAQGVFTLREQDGHWLITDLPVP